MPTTAALQKPLTDWTEADLQQLIAQQIDEGQRIEYKEQLSLQTKAERRDAAKDVSGMRTLRAEYQPFSHLPAAQTDAAKPLVYAGLLAGASS